MPRHPQDLPVIQPHKLRPRWTTLTPVQRTLGVSGIVLLFAAMLAGGAVALGAFAARSIAARQPPPPATAPPSAATHIPTTLLRLSGGDTTATGVTRSATFSVTGDWQIHYTCRTDTPRVSGALYVLVYNGNGTGAAMSGPLGPSSCPQGTSSGIITFHDPTSMSQGQRRYLEIGAAGVKWTITVTG
jgi:hypothetical protein